MFLSVSNDPNTTHVTAPNNHCHVSIVKFDIVKDFSTFDIHSHSIMNTNTWIRVADCTSIVSYTVWYTLCTNSNPLYTTQFVLQKKIDIDF